MRHWLLSVILFVVPISLEAHFTLAPKIEILPKAAQKPDALFIKLGDKQATRGDYLNYLQRLTAFNTKYQKVQTNFSSHFDLLRGVVFYHPENVHKYIDNIDLAKANEAIYQLAVKAWFRHQAEIFARLLPLRDSAKGSKLAQRPHIKPVLDLYAAGAKTALLEELIILGDMAPSVAGIKNYIQQKPDGFQPILEKGVELDTEIIPPEEQRRLKKRWSDFRKDVIAHTELVRHNELLQDDKASDSAIVAQVNAHSISLGDLNAVYGEPPKGRRWLGIRKANLSRMILYYAMADLAESLGLAPERLHKDIALSAELYLMGVQLAQQAAPALLAKDASALSLEDTRQIMQYPKVIEVKDWLLSQSMNNRQIKTEIFIEPEFISETDWSLKRILAPKHSIHL
jgi:hypothetical protein